MSYTLNTACAERSEVIHENSRYTGRPPLFTKLIRGGIAVDNMNFQVLAGILSTTIFTLSNIPMLIKAAKTRDLKSYSCINLALGNVGNLIHWIYISDLPFGPIWFMHGFYTISSAFMLLWYFRYEGSALVNPWRGLRLARKIGRSTLGRIPLPTGEHGKRFTTIGHNCCPAMAC